MRDLVSVDYGTITSKSHNPQKTGTSLQKEAAFGYLRELPEEITDIINHIQQGTFCAIRIIRLEKVI